MDDDLIDLDTEGTSAALERLADDLDSLLDDDLAPFAQAVERTFDDLAGSITGSLEGAAREGRLSVQGLVDDVLADLARLAADRFVRQPVEDLLTGGLSGILGGSTVGPGLGQNPVNVAVTMAAPGPAPDPMGRSSVQLAGSVQRALGKALRNG